MARRSTKEQIEGRRLMYEILQRARESSNPNERLKAIRTFIAYQKMIIQVQRAKKNKGSGWDNWKKLAQEVAKKPRPYPGT